MYATAGGEIFQIDNIVLNSQVNDLILFSDEMLDGYSLVKGGAGNYAESTSMITAASMDEPGHDQVILIEAGAATMLVNSIENAVAEDLSIYGAGMLKFDILIKSHPTDATANWRVKVETDNCNEGNPAEVVFGTQAGAGVLDTDTWHEISVDMGDLLADTANCSERNLRGFRRVVFLNNWTMAAGADFEIDNVALAR